MEYRTRAQWGATYDPSGREKMSLPVAEVFIHHSVTKPTNNANADMESIEQIDIARFDVPSYKWAIHPSGIVLEGMTIHGSPDTYGHNSDSLSIVFMGNFEVDYPTPSAMMAGRELVQKFRTDKLLTTNFKLLGHRDVYATACPGAHLYPRIGELLVPPKPTSTTEVVRRDENMVLDDPISGGVWVVKPDGAVFAYDGAPDLGGANNNKMNPNKFECVGIFRWKNGYGLVLNFGPPPKNTGDEFRRYRFPRDGSARV